MASGGAWVECAGGGLICNDDNVFMLILILQVFEHNHNVKERVVSSTGEGFAKSLLVYTFLLLHGVFHPIAQPYYLI